jgi:hypothetical protein
LHAQGFLLRLELQQRLLEDLALGVEFPDPERVELAERSRGFRADDSGEGGKHEAREYGSHRITVVRSPSSFDVVPVSA